MWEVFGAKVYDMDTGTFRSLTDTLPKIASYADRYFVFFFKNGSGSAYYENSEMEKAKEAGLKDFLDPEYSREYFKGVHASIQRIEELIRILAETDKTKLSNKELSVLFDRGTRELVEIFGYYLACQPQCVAGLEDELKRRLRTIIPHDKIDEIFSELAVTTRNSKIKQEEIDWLLLLLSAKKMSVSDLTHPECNELIKNHSTTYAQLHIGHSQTEYYAKKFEHEIIEDTDVLQARYEAIVTLGQKAAQKRQQILDTYNLQKDIQYIADVLAEIGHLRFEMRVSGWAPLYAAFCPLVFSEIERRYNLSHRSLDLATISEIESILKGETVAREIFQSRKDKFLMFIDDGKLKTYAGEAAEKLFNELISVDDYSGITEIKGNIAMKGKVTGRVVLFKWGDNLQNKLKEMGDNSIIVAGQTRPELMPLISKSKGIVTDEGGITSHAAIVSRELGVPCIIGTKIATQVLKDGDLIEVDAHTGIVRILK